jgi:hypothetical protein
MAPTTRSAITARVANRRGGANGHQMPAFDTTIAPLGIRASAVVPQGRRTVPAAREIFATRHVLLSFYTLLTG